MKFIHTVAAAAAVIFSATFATPVFAQSSMMGSNMAMPSCAAGDSVVWANTRTKAYHMPGTPRYGKTRHGKFVCMSQATSMGFHAAKRESMSGSNGSMGSMGTSGSMAPGTMASPGMMDDSSMSSHMGKHHKKRHGSMMNGGMMASPNPYASPSLRVTPVPMPVASPLSH